MRSFVSTALLSITIVSAACSTTTKRPPFAPLSGAFVDTLSASPTLVLGEIEGILVAEGLAIRIKNEVDRYLETKWYRTDQQRSAGPSAGHPERAVRFRVWLDEIGPLGTRVIIEVAHRRSSDPSLDPRQAEFVVGPDHAGREILNRVIEHLSERFSD